MLRSEDSFNLWQSILRGAGVITGCRRCADVCPVGADYEPMLKDALEAIAENTPQKEARLAQMVAAEPSPAYERQIHWIGRRIPSRRGHS
jgi:ferredoxin